MNIDLRVTKELAREIAILRVNAIKNPDWLGIGEIRAYDSPNWSVRKPLIYGVDFSNCWIAFIERKSFGIRESHIIAIDRDNGRVVFVGGAKDEG